MPSCRRYARHSADTGPVLDFFAIMPIERTVSSLPISFGGVGWREIFSRSFLRNLAGVEESVANLIGSLEFPGHPDLLRSRRARLFLLQTERRSRTCEIARDETRSRDARA